MTVSLLAIASIMVVGWAFGYVLRGIVDSNRRSNSEWFYGGSEADHDRWEDDPEPTNICDTCKHEKVPLWDEECAFCNDYDKWEAKE